MARSGRYGTNPAEIVDGHAVVIRAAHQLVPLHAQESRGRDMAYAQCGGACMHPSRIVTDMDGDSGHRFGVVLDCECILIFITLEDAHSVIGTTGDDAPAHGGRGVVR